MRIKILTVVLALLSSGFVLAQAAPEKANEQGEPQKPMLVEKLEQINNERTMAEQNEAHLTQETAKLIQNPQFKDFTVLVSWYKQTKTHYYFQIGWLIEKRPVLQFMKYSWKDQTVTPSNQAEVDADNNY